MWGAPVIEMIIPSCIGAGRIFVKRDIAGCQGVVAVINIHPAFRTAHTLDPVSYQGMAAFISKHRDDRRIASCGGEILHLGAEAVQIIPVAAVAGLDHAAALADLHGLDPLPQRQIQKTAVIAHRQLRKRGGSAVEILHGDAAAALEHHARGRSDPEAVSAPASGISVIVVGLAGIAENQAVALIRDPVSASVAEGGGRIGKAVAQGLQRGCHCRSRLPVRIQRLIGAVRKGGSGCDQAASGGRRIPAAEHIS